MCRSWLRSTRGQKQKRCWPPFSCQLAAFTSGRGGSLTDWPCSMPQNLDHSLPSSGLFSLLLYSFHYTSESYPSRTLSPIGSPTGAFLENGLGFLLHCSFKAILLAQDFRNMAPPSPPKCFLQGNRKFSLPCLPCFPLIVVDKSHSRLFIRLYHTR